MSPGGFVVAGKRGRAVLCVSAEGGTRVVWVRLKAHGSRVLVIVKRPEPGPRRRR